MKTFSCFGTKLLSLLLLVAMLFSLAACTGGNNSSGTTSAVDTSADGGVTEPDGDVPGLLIYDGTKYCAKVVYPAKGESALIDLTKTFAREIKEAVGSTASITRDSDMKEAGEMPEIVFGEANRAAVKTVLRQLGNSFAYKYEVSANGAYVLGTISRYTIDAAEHFVNNYLKYNLIEENGRFYLKYKTRDWTDNNPSFLDVATLCAKKDLKFDYNTTTIVSKLDPSSSAGSAQGACIDPTGRYYYLVLHKNDTAHALVKYDLQENKQVKCVTGCNTHHSNDMTYNSKENALMVVHMDDSHSISYFNPNTLEKDKTITISTSISGLAYCAENDSYVGSSGGNMYLFDKDFNRKKTLTGVATGLTHQGVECTEDYIMLIQTKRINPDEFKFENTLMIYDWDGRHLARIELTKNSDEGETLEFLNNTLYLCSYKGSQNGGSLYKLTAVLPS